MKLDVQIDDYQHVLLRMAKRVRTMMTTSLQSLSDGDKKIALEVIEMDEYVNHDDQDINDRAIELLSLLQPVARDLRIVLAGIRISTDLERIGDYAKNIAKYTIKNDLGSSKWQNEITAVGNIFLNNYDEAIVALKNLDVNLAFNAPDNDDILDQAFKELGKKIENEIHNNNDSIPLATFSMIRNLERAGDHTKNICESVIYAVKGQHIDFG